MTKILDRIRILDLGRYVSAPFCSQVLSDFGAEVIRVEEPGGGDDRLLGPFAKGESMYVAMYGHNKKGITLNLQSEKGRELLKELVKVSDVFLNNFSPRAVKSLGLDYESLREVNPSLIYASISAFGQYGPYKDRPGFDAIFQSMSGMMSITGFKDGPPTKAGSTVIDYGTGLYTALGIVLALYHRAKTGQGQEIDIAMLDVAVSFMEAVFAQYKVLHEIQPRMGNRRPFTAPTDTYKVKDGYFTISISIDRQWPRFAKLIGHEELANDPRFKDNEGRRRNREYLENVTAGWIADKTKAELTKLFDEAHIPGAPVLTITEVVSDPQIKARDMIIDIDQPGIGLMPVLGVVIKFSQTPGSIEAPTPTIGQHNKEIYCGLLGYSKEKLTQFKEEGVI